MFLISIRHRRCATKLLKKNSYQLEHVPDHFKTQEMCKVACFYPWVIGHIPDHFKTQEMCNKAIKVDPSFLQLVPDWLVSQEQLKLWHHIDDWLIRW